MKETELGELVIEWLQRERPDWEIFQEIRPTKYAGGHIADIVCLNAEDHVWIIELKTTLNLTVIRQAYMWPVHYRSIAVPIAKRIATRDERGWWYRHMKEKMEIGTIGVTEHGYVSEKYAPDGRIPEFTGTIDQIIEICRSGKTEGFGQAGGKDGGHWTPYKESIKAVKPFIKANPGCTAKDIIANLGKLHYANEHSARTNLVTNLISVETSWCEVKKRGSLDTFYYKEEQ
jgi:hypothetical protein